MAKLNKTSRRAQTAHVPAATDTPPEPIPLPNDHRETVLPIHAVGSEKYERLCSDVLKYAHPQITRKVLKRSRGQAQFGVDVEGFAAGEEAAREAPGPHAGEVEMAFAFASNLTYAAAGALLRHWLAQGRRLLWFNRVMAAVLVATALWMVAA